MRVTGVGVVSGRPWVSVDRKSLGRLWVLAVPWFSPGKTSVFTTHGADDTWVARSGSQSRLWTVPSLGSWGPDSRLPPSGNGSRDVSEPI